MSNRRSLNQQMNHVISENCRIGHSKRAEGGINTGYVYSVQYAENLRDTANGLCGFLKDEYGLKWVRDIRPEHVRAWVDAKGSNWSRATLVNHLSRLGVLEKMVERTYGVRLSLQIEPPERLDAAVKVRDKAMSHEDYGKLRDYLGRRSTAAKIAVEVTAACGLRVKEVARLRAGCINLDKMVLEVREGAKNGKYRDVPIQPKDAAFFKALKNGLRDDELVCAGVGEDGLSKGLRRALKATGLDEAYRRTSFHAIRKMYAKDRLQTFKALGLSDMAAWGKVQKELGHGEKFRQALYDAYIGSK